MKKTIILSSVLLARMAISVVAVHAQPVLVSTMPPFPVGTMDSAYSAAVTVAPGAGGAGVTWDLSGLSPVMQATVTIISPSSAPDFSTFPTTTFCAKLQPTAGSAFYAYERISATKWEQLANNYAGPGTGSDYTPNPESAMAFPMSYLNSFVDTFQKTTGSANTVTITYDGYGTLITPFATYTNVVRIRKYWGPGDYDYNWYTTAPYLGIVVSFDAQNNSYTLIRQPATTSVQPVAQEETVSLYPNPFTEKTLLKIDAVNDLHNATVSIADALGRIVKHIAITTAITEISRDGLATGLYFYNVQNNGKNVARGHLAIQ